MADIRVVVQINALERMIIVDGKTEFIDEDYWNANIQNILFPFWTSDLDRLIHLNYFSDGSYGIEKKKYVYDRATKERKWKTYQWREPTEDEVREVAERLKEKYFEFQDSDQETIQEKLFNEYGRWNKVSWEGIRMIRNFLLADCDWTQMPDAAIDADLKAQWTAYRTKLRQLPQDYDGQDADEVRFPINPVMYARFLTKRGDNDELVNEGKEYLATSDQFGIFSATTYGEYAKRIVMTIASNYKVKNPDVIFKPANFTQNFTNDQDELEALLRAVQESNV
tara:strand:+ start:1787 stop:2629 length:843 start_codon:yes stop_codon:yes gene_type:complete